MNSRTMVQELADLLREEGKKALGRDSGDSFALGYLTGILKDLAECDAKVAAVVQSYLDMKR